MRHGTSAWLTGVHLDHQRPLNELGKVEPAYIASQLIDISWRPELAIVSDARRTTQTWQVMAKKLPEATARYRHELYHAGPEAFEREVGGLESSVQTILVLGHNPGWEAVVDKLADVTIRMAPAHAALLVGAGETWWDALAGHWRLERVLEP